MIEIIHTADLGLKYHPYGGINPKTGLNRRFEDVYRTLMFIVNKAIKRKVRFVIIAGDINEERNPDSILIEKFCEQIIKLVDAGIDVIIIPGNHDIDSSIGTSTSVTYLKKLQIPRVHIADFEIETFKFEKQKIAFHCVPYFMKYNTKTGARYDTNDDISKYVNESIDEMKLVDGYFNILVSHYSTEKTFEGLYVDEVKLKMKPLRRFDYVALGHIHKYEMFESEGICGGYSGSIYKKDFGENYDKFCNVVKIDKDVSYEKMKLPVREFMDCEVNALDCDAEDFYEYIFENLKGHVKDKIVKLKIRVNNRFGPKPIYDFLRSEGVFHFVPIIWDKVRKTKTQKIKNPHRLTDTQIVAARLDSMSKHDDEFKNRVYEMCEQVINECNEN